MSRSVCFIKLFSVVHSQFHRDVHSKESRSLKNLLAGKVVESEKKKYRPRLRNHHSDNVSSVMGRDDSWLATVPSVVPTGDCSH